jgi:excisionase family DNA binding protein
VPKKSKKKRRLVTDSDAAERLGVSRTTIRRLRYAGELPTVYVRGAARIDEAEIDRYIHEHTAEGGDAA